MPKMKTDSGARKRVKVTGTGRLARESEFAPGDARQVKRMLGR
jgi:ribosomal protein L35